MVLDRLFLWIFTMAVVVGTAGIILQAPSLYDDRSPIDKELSDIGQQVKFLYIVVWTDLTPLVSCFRTGTDRTLTKSGLEELEPPADLIQLGELCEKSDHGGASTSSNLSLHLVLTTVN